MYLPRRFRRRVLLPPGWVALGFLLWLGCMVVRGHWRRLRQERVIQIAMPLPGHRNDDYVQLFTVQSARQDIYQIRHWQKLKFMGHDSDSLVLRRVTQALVALDDKTQPSRGLAICLVRNTQYRYLVGVLDLLNQHNVKRYMLDSYQVPATLYVLGPHFRPRPRHHQMALYRPLELR